eukprot:gene725-2513_t
MQFVVLASLASHAAGKDVLFVGNSYSFYNGGVWNVVDKIANNNRDGDNAPAYQAYKYTTHTKGGAKLYEHAVNADVAAKIAEGPDVVVLQDQSHQ